MILTYVGFHCIHLCIFLSCNFVCKFN